MFPKTLPLNINNHNYLYSVVMANRNISNSEKEIVTDTITEDFTDGRIDETKVSGQFFYVKIVLFMLLVVIVASIINSLVDIVRRAWCSKPVSEKTPLLKNNNNPQKMI